MNSYEAMTWEERVDWSASYLLTSLIAGEFRRGVWMVLDMAVRHPLDTSSAKKPRRPKERK